jgi:hypothetical protein
MGLPGIGTWISYFFFSCFVVGNLFLNHERGKEERNTDISPRGRGGGLSRPAAEHLRSPKRFSAASRFALRAHEGGTPSAPVVGGGTPAAPVGCAAE